MATQLSDIFSINTEAGFEQCCLATFRFQAQHCAVYKEYLRLLGVNPKQINTVQAIPFLPIVFFKTRKVITGRQPEQMVFTSSGTTGAAPSRHFVTDVSVYEKSFSEGFRYFYGAPSDYTILALLPSYLERQGSSLVEFLCWNQDAGALFRELGSLYKACGADAPRGMQEFELLPPNAPTERLVEMFTKIAMNSLAAIRTVLEGGRCRLARIADDFARDCQIRLCSGGMVEEEWRTFLYNNMDAVLGGKARELRLKSESVIAFRDALRKLGEVLA